MVLKLSSNNGSLAKTVAFDRFLTNFVGALTCGDPVLRNKFRCDVAVYASVSGRLICFVQPYSSTFALKNCIVVHAWRANLLGSYIERALTL